MAAPAGIIGPAAFIAAWVVAGARTGGYSAVDQAISRLAASGAPTRTLMTLGFVCFGIAMPVYGLVLRRHLGGRSWMAATTSGVATLGVALFALGTSSAIDGLHNTMAALGYLALVATPLLAARPLADAGHRRAAAASLVAAGMAGVCLIATLVGPAHGLFQRVGLTIVDAWLMTSTLAIIAQTRRSPVRLHGDELKPTGLRGTDRRSPDRRHPEDRREVGRYPRRHRHGPRRGSLP